jgi:hypothetical protein
MRFKYGREITVVLLILSESYPVSIILIKTVICGGEWAIRAIVLLDVKSRVFKKFILCPNELWSRQQKVHTWQSCGQLVLIFPIAADLRL